MTSRKKVNQCDFLQSTSKETVQKIFRDIRLCLLFLLLYTGSDTVPQCDLDKLLDQQIRVMSNSLRKMEFHTMHEERKTFDHPNNFYESVFFLRIIIVSCCLKEKRREREKNKSNEDIYLLFHKLQHLLDTLCCRIH